MAASIKSLLGCNVETKPGSTGQFDVLVDGRKVYSKADTGRFPADGEVEQLLAALK